MVERSRKARWREKGAEKRARMYIREDVKPLEPEAGLQSGGFGGNGSSSESKPQDWAGPTYCSLPAQGMVWDRKKKVDRRVIPRWDEELTV